MQSSITPHVIADRAWHRPDDVFVTEIDGPTLSYGEFHDLSLRWADVLDGLGVLPGDAVANAAGGAPAYWTWLGAAWRGARHIPINPDLRGRLLTEALELTEASVLIAQAALLPQIAALAPQLTRLTTVLVVERAPDDVLAAAHLTVLDAADLLAQARPRPRPRLTPGSVSLAVFTSGTTGASKCAERSWQMIEAGGQWMFPRDIGATLPGGGYYNPWPVFHGMALSGLAVATQRDLRMVLRRRFSVRWFWDDVRSHACTHAMLQTVAPMLFRQPARDDDRENPLRYVTIVPLMRDFRQFGERFDVTVSTMYGQSETGPVLAASAPSDYRIAGRPIPGMDVELVDPDGRPSPAGEAGELVVRPNGCHAMSTSYIGAPEAMAARRLDGGWFRTGDAFRRDEQGYFQFVDRLKDYIRHRGHNLSSSELEREVHAHPDVAECAAVGVPSALSDDDVMGDEDVKLVVVRRPGSRLTGDELVSYLRPRVTRYMVPSLIEFVDALPRTPTFKVRKAELRTIAAGGEVWSSPPRVGEQPDDRAHCM